LYRISVECIIRVGLRGMRCSRSLVGPYRPAKPNCREHLILTFSLRPMAVMSWRTCRSANASGIIGTFLLSSSYVASRQRAR